MLILPIQNAKATEDVNKGYRDADVPTPISSATIEALRATALYALVNYGLHQIIQRFICQVCTKPHQRALLRFENNPKTVGIPSSIT